MAPHFEWGLIWQDVSRCAFSSKQWRTAVTLTRRQRASGLTPACKASPTHSCKAWSSLRPRWRRRSKRRLLKQDVCHGHPGQRFHRSCKRGEVALKKWHPRLTATPSTSLNRAACMSTDGHACLTRCYSDATSAVLSWAKSVAEGRSLDEETRSKCCPTTTCKAFPSHNSQAQSSCKPGAMGTAGATGRTGYSSGGTSAVAASVDGGVGAATSMVGSAAATEERERVRSGWSSDNGIVAAAFAVVEPIEIDFETLGTPAAFRPNTIQGPGRATPGSAGTVTAYVLPRVAVHTFEALPQSSMRRWSVFTVCVDEP